ncbi:MAG: phosphodiester glycosidase family protein [Bacteroidales bacterium]|nr:phosphodiester glycosidase family protein [Bacteroidales bacterium]
MRKCFLILAAAVPFLLLPGCTREQDVADQAGPVVTIQANLPEEPLSKAGFNVPDSGDGLHLAWKAGDCIRVISGNSSAVYNIVDGFTDHVAKFSGPEVPGNVFTIICPGTYTSVAAAQAGNPNLTQVGNGNTDHLVFTAKLSGVAKSDLPNITFSDDWVAQHPNTTLNRGGIVKFVLTLPDAVSSPTKVMLTGLGSDIISVNLENITLGSDKVLTAYAQSGWEDVSIDWAPFTVTVLDADGTAYAATNTISGSKTLKAGAQNTIKITGGFTEQLFSGGDGTQGNPYLIANAKQLDNMHVDGIMKHQEKVYFRVIDDIDMADYLTTHEWVPLNWETPYDRPVNFDGGSHTIDHFYCSFDKNKATQGGADEGALGPDRPYDKPAFFGLLYGECYDLYFTNALVENTYSTPTGILAGYCGYSAKKAQVWNVHVQGTVTFTAGSGVANNQTSCVGGFAGRVEYAFIDSCSADVTVISNKNYCGGFFGIDWGEASTIRNCFSTGSVKGDQRVGGFCGGLIKNDTQIINCWSDASVSASRCAGGIVGFANLDSNKNYTTNLPDNVIQGCIAWQSEIHTRTYDGADSGNNYYSSGAILGITATHNYLIDCLRRSDMDFCDYTGNMVLYDQENASPSVPLVLNNPKPATYTHYYPYHGKAFTGTLSQAAKSLGWDETVWDLSGDTPVLTGAVEVLSAEETPKSGAGDVPPGSDSLRGLGEVRPQEGDANWTILEVADGITYYYYSGYCPETENLYQDVYIVDLDLSNPDYEVKVVYANPTMICSEVFESTNAWAAINGGYEKASIAVRANGLIDDGGIVTYYTPGVYQSLMPNNYITDSETNEQIPNWKSEGTFYTDGKRNVKIAFDGYDPSTPTKTKSVKEERLFYQLCTDEWDGLISSAPVLIHDFNPVGKQFKDLHPKTYTSSEDPNTHQRGQYPRTAVALTEGNHFLMVVCDGRYATGSGGNGMSAYWLTVFLAKYFNPQYAINLDGGGSTTMCVKHSDFDMDNYVVNYPCDNRGNKNNKHNHYGERARDSFIVIVDAE